MEQTFSLTEKFKLFLKISTPVILTQFALVGATFVAVFLTGQYSTVDLAGLSIGYNIWISCFFGTVGILLGITPIISQLLGANKKEDLPVIIWQGLYLGLFASVLLILTGVIALEPLLDYIGLAADAKAICLSYMKGVAFALPALLMLTTLRYVVDSHGYTRYSMIIMWSGLIASIFFNYGLIPGHFGFPALGGTGAGISLAIVAWLNLLSYVAIVSLSPTFTPYQIFRKIQPPQWYHIREQLKLGIPIGISIFSEISIFSVAGLLMTQFGTEIIAAHQTAISFTSLFYCFPLSISMASTIVVAYEVGAKRLRDALTYANLARWVAISIAILICLYSFTHIEDIARIYTTDEKMVSLIQSFISFAVFFTVIDAFGTPIQGILRAYKDVNSITIISIFSYWGVCLPVGYILKEYFGYGPYSIWIGLLASIGVAAIAFTWRLWKIQYRIYPISDSE